MVADCYVMKAKMDPDESLVGDKDLVYQKEPKNLHHYPLGECDPESE